MMNPLQEYALQSRRNFLATSASGIGTLALAALLRDEGLLAAESVSPLAPRPHFAPRGSSAASFRSSPKGGRTPSIFSRTGKSTS